jgi:hypothetical protein
MVESLKTVCHVAMACALLLTCGCGAASDQPELGDVEGVVTLDGKPVVGLNVVFRPETGRPAGAMTDDSGHYELEYLDGVSGCKLGAATVAFEWPPEAANAVSIPAKYNSTEAFKVDVKAGSNTFDFAMQSK